MTRAYLTPAEFAARVRIAHWKVRELCQTHENHPDHIRNRRIGRNFRIPLDEPEQWMARAR